MDDFEKNLQRLKRLAPVATVCMYGRPLSPYDNRDMFKIDENHDRLIRQLHVLGEVYLDIDYEDITHTSKTGRNWSRQRANRPDFVESGVSPDLAGGQELLDYLRERLHLKLIIQIHPERWTDSRIENAIQFSKDTAANLIKAFL